MILTFKNSVGFWSEIWEPSLRISFRNGQNVVFCTFCDRQPVQFYYNQLTKAKNDTRSNHTTGDICGFFKILRL